MSTLYTTALLAHANAPDHPAVPDHPTAKASLTNPLCGDHIEVGIRVVDGVFEAVGFATDACAICVASASVMAQQLTGRPLDQFERHFEMLEAVTRGAPTCSSALDVFEGLTQFPSRTSCAVLPWRALERALHRPSTAPSPVPTRTDPPLADRSPWRTIQAIRAAGDQAALATLISVEGSSPCPLGSRMIVSSTGDFWGAVSGGCVESAVVRSALALLTSHNPTASQIQTYTIANSQAGEPQLACGGRICVHIAPAPTDAQLESYLHAQRHAEAVRIVPLMGGDARLLARDTLGQLPAPLARAALEVLDGGPALFEQEGESWFLEPLRSPPNLVLVGATHIAQVLARLSTELGFNPVVVDPRTAVATPGRFPDARLVLEPPGQALADLVDDRTAVVMLSHDEKLDDPALKVALSSRAFYVGALGSRKTQRARLERLRAAGLDDSALRRLRGPAGLPIGGKGAAEIALSILAEIVATRRAAIHREGRVGAVVLAAGSSRRAGAVNKLLHEIDGEPMIRRVVRTVLDAGTAPCVVVLGHDGERVRGILNDLAVTFVVNESHTEGMGTSIARGIEAMTGMEVDAAFVVLGDMPLLRAEDLERLTAAHSASTRHLIIVPEAGQGAARRSGNPVLWPRRYFDQLAALRGDRGAKSILLSASGAVLRVPIEHHGVLFDVDAIAVDPDDSEHQGLPDTARPAVTIG
ncbi:MAG: XdhC family protein [Deltaproteobacteria bacterium]|nr:XdhC family protein [Deltaproteobacteria bacterium]